MRKYLFFVIIISSLFSCQESKVIKELSSIILIDTFNNELNLDTASHISIANFIPFYIGEQKDTILMKYFYNNKNAFQDYELPRTYPPRPPGGYSSPDKNKRAINLFVDTSTIIGSNNMRGYYRRDSMGIVSRGKNKSYPLFIKNQSKDTLNIGYGNYLPAVIEAKDSLGEWKAIQKYYTYYCGTGLNYIFLEPDGIILTSVALFSGEYKTKMRVVYNFRDEVKIYSNEFQGTINYSQFEKRKLNNY